MALKDRQAPYQRSTWISSSLPFYAAYVVYTWKRLITPKVINQQTDSEDYSISEDIL